MGKTMCKISPKEDFEKFIESIENPEFYCRSCGRVANKEKRLCKPEKIKKKSGEEIKGDDVNK